jgi:hypothetical protein
LIARPAAGTFLKVILSQAFNENMGILLREKLAPGFSVRKDRGREEGTERF